MTDGMNRRRFLKVLGITGGGAAVLSGCGIGPEPTEKLIPYLVPPEDQIPGTATYYASTCRECAAGCGIHVRVREGRAVKIEGNPGSPVNHGRLCARGQAALQGLYNPDRIRAPMRRNAQGHLEETTWDKAIPALAAAVAQAKGKGIVFLSGIESGSFADLVDEWMQAVGGRRVAYEAFGFEALREGNRLSFGDASIPWYDFANAKYIVSFGADFMETWLSPVGFQNGFSRAHAFDATRDGSMAKYVYVGPRLPLSGMSADEWVGARPGTEGLLALAMAQVILSRKLAAGTPADAGRLTAQLPTPEQVAKVSGIEAAHVTRLAEEFARSGGGLAVAGGVAAQYANGAEIVAAVNILNYVVGAVGTRLKFGADLAAGRASRFTEAAELVSAMGAGSVGLLLVHGTNPIHSLGGGFAQAWAKVGMKVSFSSYLDETAAAADLVLPDYHPLEQWNDARPRAGVFALQQPVMIPVFQETMHAGDVILKAAGKPGSFKDYLQAKWRELHKSVGGSQPFDDWWVDVLAAGGVFGGEPPARTVHLSPDASRAVPATPPASSTADATLVVFPSYALHDGRGANKPWLQELPDPVSKIAWHGWVEVHPETAKKWQLASGDIVLLSSKSGRVRAPVWITPSILPGVLAVPTGQGHTAYGRYAQDRSFNAFDLLPDTANGYGGRSFVVDVSVTRSGDHRRLATTEGTSRDHGEQIVTVLGIAQARALKPGALDEEEIPAYARSAVEGWGEAQHEMASLGNYAGDHPRWAMAVDLSKCTGCSACVTACYAENNLATVGEELFTHRRWMSWMRIERYFREDEGKPLQVVTSPVMCQQCGNAPCEPVCPVYAAYHTPDGLNAQVYNRCVGTRYCANNCPYKVRYFNWYNYAERGGEWEAWPEPLSWQLNPDVTVREKGVMEKCTFCVQRIRGAQNRAKVEDRAVQDGEIVPACAQSCPSEAIVFGDLHDPKSRVHALAQDPRGYHVLAGLNTKPGVTYLARVTAGAET
ncbi:MAG TPA: molybdopterin-dependent oxidoreductase [Gemmatimonadales bacterium]|nr:molybdopterin-dependent oxidoreductase [Gemmatimonadales bacterium]